MRVGEERGLVDTRVVVPVMAVYRVARQLCVDLHSGCKGHPALRFSRSGKGDVMGLVERLTTTDARTAKGTSLRD